MSVIFADTNCDLEKSQVKKLNISLVNLDSKNNLSAFKKAFQPYLDKDEDIIYLATDYSKVAKEYEDSVKYFGNLYEKRIIKYIDLKSCSASAGLSVYQAGLMFKRGCTDTEIINFVNEYKNNVYGLVITQNREFLNKCDTQDKINVNSLSNLISPIVFMRNNKFEVLDKAQGKKKAIGNLVKFIKDSCINVADYPLMVCCDEDTVNAEYLKESLIKTFGDDVIVLIQKYSELNSVEFDKKSLYVGFYSKRIRV